jgi:hypothetical protein
MMTTTTIRCLLTAILLLAQMPFAMAAKKDYIVWHLNVHFINGSKNLSNASLETHAKDWVEIAERVYQKTPRLKIAYEIIKQSTKDGKDLSEMVFDSLMAYASYMDKNFDNVATTKTEGYLTVLITDKLCIGKYKTGANKGQYKCWGGYANFPHWVNPFSKKRGITLVSTVDEYTFTHELGHVLGLKHTFEPYVGLNLQCNEEYTPKGKPEGLCNSCDPSKVIYDTNGDPDQCNGPSNIMDYCTSKTNDEFLNECQETRTANQRYDYMTDDGKTNYFELKGLAGEAVCTEDSDCEEGRYCDEGPAGVGRNQCKVLKPIGQACTRGGECASDRCAGLKCAEAHDCFNNDDCNTGEYCNLGVAGVGRNTCNAKLADGVACTGDHQCGSSHCSPWRPQDGQASGICYTPASKKGGESCKIDLECIVGKCNSQKECVCKTDGDCKSGYWCDKGFDLVANSCKAKLNKGEVCGTVGEVGVGHRCKSGECKVSGISTKLKCQ